MVNDGLYQERKTALATPVKKVKPVVKMPQLKFLASVLHSFCQVLQKNLNVFITLIFGIITNTSTN